MNLTFSRLFATSRKNSANWFTRLLFGWFLLCSGSAASASITNDVAAILSVLNTRLDENLSAIGSDVSSIWGTDKSILQQVQYIRSDLSSDLSTINGNVTDVENYLRQINNKLPNSLPDYSSALSAISSSLSLFSSQNHSDIGDLKTSVAAFKTQDHSDQNRNWIMLSNIWERLKVSGGGSDVLAGNAWWHTNSAFVLSAGKYSSVYPTDVPDTTGVFSFPQFISKWSSFLSMPATTRALTPSQMQNNWSSWFGLSAPRFSNANATTENIYTWFDWMSDAMRSNWVVQASSLTALRGISNAVLSSSGSSSSLTFEDVLAANPWWATNSAFARSWASYAYVFPRSEFGLSFPEAFSAFLSGRTSTSISRSSLWDDFGIGGINQGRLYTFDDWLAEAIKSNLVLTTSTSVSNLEAELAATDYEDPVAPTNTPLPGYVDLVSEGDTSAGASEISTGQTRVLNQVDALSGMLDSATPSSEIVVIPEMTIGGIHVAEHRAQLATSITPVAHRIMFFLWYVALFSSLFSLAQGEFAFYASLGRHWSMSHGALTERN